MVLKISSDRYLMVKTLKRFGYWSPPPSGPLRRRYKIVAASRSEEINYERKKAEITRIALQHVYEAPSLREPKQITTRQMRLKMILHEALDLAHSICEDQDAQECLWAWEMVDEIDDAATRAGVRYH
jgi:hypothetical protein